MKSKRNQTDNNHVWYLPAHDPAAWSQNASQVNLTAKSSISEILESSVSLCSVYS